MLDFSLINTNCTYNQIILCGSLWQQNGLICTIGIKILCKPMSVNRVWFPIEESSDLLTMQHDKNCPVTLNWNRNRTTVHEVKVQLFYSASQPVCPRTGPLCLLLLTRFLPFTFYLFILVYIYSGRLAPEIILKERKGPVNRLLCFTPREWEQAAKIPGRIHILFFTLAYIGRYGTWSWQNICHTFFFCCVTDP